MSTESDALEMLHALLPFCPMCSGRVTAVYSRPLQLVLACEDCGTSIVIPATAWEVAQRKQESKWPPAPDQPG